MFFEQDIFADREKFLTQDLTNCVTLDDLHWAAIFRKIFLAGIVDADTRDKGWQGIQGR